MAFRLRKLFTSIDTYKKSVRNYDCHNPMGSERRIILDDFYNTNNKFDSIHRNMNMLNKEFKDEIEFFKFRQEFMESLDKSFMGSK